jgi:hypothetical protein
VKTNSTMRERVGVYVLGVAIGLVIVGLMVMGRYQAHQRQEAARQGEIAVQERGSPGPTTESPHNVQSDESR